MSLLKLELISNPDDLSWHDLVQRGFETIVTQCGIEGLEGILLPSAIVEAVNNIIEHAYQYTDGHPIGVEALCQGGALVVVLRDRGRPMPQPLPPGDLPAETAEGGRGWKIIRSVFPDVHYERIDGENQLRLKRPLASGDLPENGPTPPSAHQ